MENGPIDGAGLDANRQHRIPWVETVDGHLDAALRPALELAQILVDHLRQFFSGFLLLDGICGCRMLWKWADGGPFAALPVFPPPFLILPASLPPASHP